MVTISIKEEVKILLIKKGITLTELVKMLNDKFQRNDTVQNLSKKLSKNTLKYREAVEIAEILGYKLQFIQDTTKE